MQSTNSTCMCTEAYTCLIGSVCEFKKSGSLLKSLIGDNLIFCFSFYQENKLSLSLKARWRPRFLQSSLTKIHTELKNGQTLTVCHPWQRLKTARNTSLSTMWHSCFCSLMHRWQIAGFGSIVISFGVKMVQWSTQPLCCVTISMEKKKKCKRKAWGFRISGLQVYF